MSRKKKEGDRPIYIEKQRIRERETPGKHTGIQRQRDKELTIKKRYASSMPERNNPERIIAPNFRAVKDCFALANKFASANFAISSPHLPLTKKSAT